MKKLPVFFILGVLLPFAVYSQVTQLTQFQPLERNEYTFALGASYAYTDLGGSPGVGTHFLKDFNPSAMREGGYFGYRRRLNNSFSVKGVFTLGEVYANDNLSSNEYRFNRNQNFRSIIVEPSLQLEYYFYQHNHPGHLYKIKHAHGFKSLSIDAYIFAGVGGFYFNPQGQYIDGQWYDLRPLHTEGEGLPGGPSEYSLFAFCIPAGAGAKYLITNEWSVGLEASTRVWTSTDYLDDTHDKYYNPQVIEQNYGPIAAYFSHPVLGLIPGQDIVGTERGDPNNNDTYMFLFFTVNYRPAPHRRHHRYGRARF